MSERRFPPPWSVDEAALPSSPDRNVDNGRGQGIPEVSRSDQPPRPKISRTPLVRVGPAASCRTDANGQALAYVYFEDEPGRRSLPGCSPATRPGASPPTLRSCQGCCSISKRTGEPLWRLSRRVRGDEYRVQGWFPCIRGGNGQAFKGATRFSSGSCTRPRKRECFMYR